MNEPETAERERHWNRVYAGRAEDEVSWYESEPEISLRLIERAGTARAAPVLDVGGGLSRLGERLAEEGYGDVTVLDVSAEAIRRLLGRQPAASPLQGIAADVTRWQPPRRYALWHDRAVLHFLTAEEDRQAYRRTLLAALQPDGQAIIATFAPAGPETCSGLPVRRYGAADLEALFGPELALEESFEFDHRTPAARVQRFHAARLRRTAPAPG